MTEKLQPTLERCITPCRDCGGNDCLLIHWDIGAIACDNAEGHIQTQIGYGHWVNQTAANFRRLVDAFNDEREYEPHGKNKYWNR